MVYVGLIFWSVLGFVCALCLVVSCFLDLGGLLTMCFRVMLVGPLLITVLLCGLLFVCCGFVWLWVGLVLDERCDFDVILLVLGLVLLRCLMFAYCWTGLQCADFDVVIYCCSLVVIVLVWLFYCDLVVVY